MLKPASKNKSLVLVMALISVVLLVVGIGLGTYFFVYLRMPGVVLERGAADFKAMKDISFTMNGKVVVGDNVVTEYEAEGANDPDTEAVSTKYKTVEVLDTKLSVVDYYFQEDKHYISASAFADSFLIKPDNNIEMVEFSGEIANTEANSNLTLVNALIEEKEFFRKQNYDGFFKDLEQLIFDENSKKDENYAYKFSLDKESAREYYDEALDDEDLGLVKSAEVTIQINKKTHKVEGIAQRIQLEAPDKTTGEVTYTMSMIKDDPISGFRKSSMGYSEFLGYLDLAFGQEGATVSLTAYDALGGPFSQRYYTDTYSQLHEKYVTTGKVAYRFRPFDLSFIPTGKSYFMLLACSFEQGAGEEAYKYFGTSEITTENMLINLKEVSGFNAETYKSCVETNKYSELYDKLNAESIAAGIGGTPNFILSNSRAENVLIPGAVALEAFDVEIAKLQ